MLAFSIAAVLIVIGLFHELRWRTRSRDAIIVQAVVVDIHGDGDDGYFPELEFVYNGVTRRFRSTYSIPPTPFIGSKVPVMLDCFGESPELYTPRSRWLFTVIPLTAGAIFLIVGCLTF